MNFDFRIHAKLPDGTVNRRFHKVRYTAALRFGVVLQERLGLMQLSFQGEPTNTVAPHGDNKAYVGSLHLEGNVFDDVIVIVRPRNPKPELLITFWPNSQHPDAHQSYTDPLVDTALDGTPFNVHVVAARMHEVFKVNAGASPATLMKLLYEEEAETLRAGAARLADLLEESFIREQEISNERDKERSARVEAEKARDAAQAELNVLKQRSFIQPSTNTPARLSDPTVLIRATTGVRGTHNKRAVLLHMSDGSVRACNWEQGFDARLKYAQMLEGATVRTDVWGSWSGRDWFNNIYPTTEPVKAALVQDDGVPF